MDLQRERRRNGLFSDSNKKAVTSCCACVVFFTICALLSSVCNEKPCLESRISCTDDSCAKRAKSRRQLIPIGPGSLPPRCLSKCGGCTPCFLVHIRIPPGTPMIAEYYPEAWRCKCGNQLYML